MQCVSQHPGYGGGFLQCQAVTIADLTISTMYSMKKDSMTIQISIHMWHKKIDIQTLLDSGATHNFLDKQTVKTSCGREQCNATAQHAPQHVFDKVAKGATASL